MPFLTVTRLIPSLVTILARPTTIIATASHPDVAMVAKQSSKSSDSRFAAATLWKRLYPKWSKRFLVDPGRPHLGSWLSSKWKDGKGVGCTCCHWAGINSPFSNFQAMSVPALQAVNFAKHDRNPTHRAAAAAYAQMQAQQRLAPSYSQMQAQQSSAASAEFLQCPSESDFLDVVKLVGNGCGLENRKHRRILWCLQQALKQRDMNIIKSSAAISLFRDERKGRLLVRFRCVGHDLSEFSGTLGQARGFGTGAAAITNATEQIMVRACTELHGPPQGAKCTPALKQEILEHLKARVLCLTVDSASDELLSAEMMRSTALSAAARALTPGLRFVIRDKAHSARRVVSRPWAADPFIKETAMIFARGRGSIARMIHNSVHIRRIFVNYTRTCRSKAINSNITNLRAAAHRFESFQKPLGRTCIFLHACIRTALHISRRQHDDMAKMAKTWLKSVTTERCLMLAMMADASDQAMQLTRILDDETADPAVLNREVLAFSLSITGLFGSLRRCLSTFGYTSMMLKLLKIPIVWQVDGDSYHIGDEAGVQADIIDNCIARMRSYIVLSRAALKAEFPTFELAQDSCVIKDSWKFAPPIPEFIVAVDRLDH